MWVALVNPSQTIAFGVKPYVGPVGRFDDASRMNGAEMLARWRLKPGSHKDIGTVTGVHRPASFPTEQISRHYPIATPNQFTLSGFSRHHRLHIRLKLDLSFKQRCEQAGLNIPLYRIHNSFLSFPSLVRFLIFDRDPNVARDVPQDLAQSQPTQLKGFLDSEDGDLLPLCGKPLPCRL